MAAVGAVSQETTTGVAEVAAAAALIEAPETTGIDQAPALEGQVTGSAHHVTIIISPIAKNATDAVHRSRPAAEPIVAEAAAGDLTTVGGTKKMQIQGEVMCLEVPVGTLIIETTISEIEAEIETATGIEIETEIGRIETETGIGTVIETVIEIGVDMVAALLEIT